MAKTECLFEKVLLGEMEKGQLASGSKEHLKSCPLCRETLLINRWLVNFSCESELQQRSLPDSSLLWERAHAPQTRRVELERKFSRVSTLLQGGAVFVFLSFALFFILKHAARLKDSVNSIVDTRLLGYTLNHMLTIGLRILPFVLVPLLLAVVSLWLFNLSSEKKLQNTPHIFV